MIDWKRKLSSRKFWALLAGFVAGVMVIASGDSSIETITGAIMSAGSIVAYILGESWVDSVYRISRKESDNNE